MEEHRIYEDFTFVLRRARKALGAVGVLFIVLVFVYWKVQVLDSKKYRRLAQANSIREVAIPAPRGFIADRNGILLADNIASFKAFLIRENTKDLEKSLRDTASLLNIDLENLKKRMERFAWLPRFKPIVIKDKLTMEEVSLVEARKSEFPELMVEAEPSRFYPFGDLAAHALGYLQEPSQEEIAAGIYKKENLGDLVGKAGIERAYQSMLVGTDGKLIEVVDSLGRSRGELGRVDPKQGTNIKLSLDIDLQVAAKEILENREGAVVVLDPRTGEVLALASYPTFDPNKFISRFTPEEWMKLANDPGHPLENRAIRGLYAPGSIFKLTVALGALDSYVINPRTVFFCGGVAEFYGRPFACWHKGGHGSIALVESVRNSCNIYFYNVGIRLGIDRIARYSELLGFGKKTGVDLPEEKEGLVPSPEWKIKARREPWYAGETISVAIGQGPILVTPLQVAAHTALIANRGNQVSPHLLKSKGSGREEQEEPFFLAETGRPSLPQSVFTEVISGMWKSVNEEGTGKGSKIEEFDVCGKTGSTQVIGRERAERLKKEIKTHSWFTGFAPRDNPRVVVTVLVEFGGLGGATAAPLARRLFEVFRKKHGQ